MAATKGLMDHLFMAACEWFLMFWVFIDATLASSLTKFAQYCELQIPCLLCSRFDHFFGNEEPGSNLNLFCNKHQTDISYLIYCDLHNKLVDVREMCEDCLRPVTLQSQSNLESFRFVVGAIGREKEGYRRSNKNFVCVSSGIRTCSCCKRQWKAKSSGRAMVQPNVVGSGVAKATTKPPLPRVSRRNRSRRPDSFKKMRNKIKHRRVDPLFPVGFPEFKFTSDSEFEFLFSDDDDGSFKVVGIGERSLRDDVVARGSKNNEIQRGGLCRRAYSTSDLRSALIEAQLNESRRIRSASLTPNCSIGHGLTEMNKKLNIMQFPRGKTREFDLSKAKRDKKPSSSDGYGSLDGSHDQCKIFTRHSFSAADLRSALLLEMLLDNSLPRRSASVTPNTSSGHGLGEANFPKSQSRPKVKRYKKSRNTINAQGSLDDSVVSRITGSHSHNQNQIPRRHSCSVFHIGRGRILLNMPVDESLTSRSTSSAPTGSIGHGSEELKKSKFHKGEKENNQLPPTGSTKRFSSSSHDRSSLDDSVVSARTGGQDQNTIPRRHSYSAFDLGRRAVHVEMHTGQSLRNRSASVTPNASVGYGFGEPKKSKNQTRHIPSHPQELRSHNHGKSKRDKKPLPSMNSINRLSSPPNVRSEFLATSLDDSVIARNVNNPYRNVNPRRHSYSAFELGCALLLNMNLDESLKRRSASLAPNGSIDRGLEEPKKLESQKDNPLPPQSSNKRLSSSFGIKSDSSITFSDKTKRHGSLDDSVVSRRTGTQNQNETPRRHSISAFDLGRALLIEMQLDESLKSHSSNLHSSEPNSLQSHHQKSKKDKNPLPLPPNSISLDDSFVSKNRGSHNQHTIPRRHSYSVLELGCAILLNMKTDETINDSTSLDPNSSVGNNSSTLQKYVKDKKSLPPMSSVKGFSSSSDVRSDLSIDKAKRHGSLDDSVVSRSTGSQNQNETPRRHSISAFDLGRALLVEMYLDESLKRCYASSVPNCSAGIVSTELNQSKLQNQPNSHSSEYSSVNSVQLPYQKIKRDKKPLPPPNTINNLGSSSDVRSERLTISFKKTNGYGSLDDSVVVSRSTSDHNQYNSPRRHSYSAYEMGLTPSCSIGHNLEEPKNSKTETRPNSLNARKKAEGSRHKRSRKDAASSTDVRSDLSSASLYKPDGHVAFDDSFVSYNRDNQKQHTNLTRSSYSTSDLRALHLQQMNLDESLTSKSASLAPKFSIGQGSGELDWLTFQTGTSSCSLEFGYLSSTQLAHRKRKKHDYPKAKKAKKSLPSTNNVKVVSSSTIVGSDLDQTDGYGSFDDYVVSNNNDKRNRYNTFSRNSQSAADLGSAYLLEMHLEDSSRRRSASVTPSCDNGYAFGESKWSKSPSGPSRYHSPEFDSHNPVQFPVEEAKQNDLQEVEKDKKPPLPSMNHAKEIDFSTNIRSDLCTSCLDKIDGRSLDGRSVCESEIDAGADKQQKLQAEDDLRCMRLLQSELEAERNAATVAAHHAMNMITRLQQEKAALQMEALQYLRMMEEQAEYDMEALQKANELVEEKENEIQDLVDELERYRRKYGDESTRNVHMHAPIKALEEEKTFVLQWLSTLEQKLHQISNGISNGDIKNDEKLQFGHLKDENSKDSSISKGVNDKSQENKNLVDFAQIMVSKDGGEVDLATIQHEIAYLKEKMETFEADLEFLKHACNTLHSDEGLEFIQEITLQLQDLRTFMFDRKYISSS